MFVLAAYGNISPPCTTVPLSTIRGTLPPKKNTQSIGRVVGSLYLRVCVQTFHIHVNRPIQIGTFSSYYTRLSLTPYFAFSPLLSGATFTDDPKHNQ